MISCVTFLLLIFSGYRILDRVIRTPRIGKYNIRYILVTGCDTGFGNRLAKRLDKLGCHVFAGCFTQAGLDELKSECSSNLIPVKMDVTNPASVRQAFDVVKSKLPDGRGLWGVLNNAGIMGAVGALEWLTIDDYIAVSRVNLYGLIDVSMTFLPLIKLERGRVVNTTSIAGRYSGAYFTPYSVSKYGVEAFTDCLRRTMRPFEVNAILIEPGMYRTSMAARTGSIPLVEKSWNQASQESREEYGEVFYQYSMATLTFSTTAVYKFIRNKILGMLDAWSSDKVDNVVDAYEHALLGCYPRARYVVGFDANYVWWTLQILPEWLGDWIFSKGQLNQPLPAAIVERNKKKL